MHFKAKMCLVKGQKMTQRELLISLKLLFEFWYLKKKQSWEHCLYPAKWWFKLLQPNTDDNLVDKEVLEHE